MDFKSLPKEQICVHALSHNIKEIVDILKKNNQQLSTPVSECELVGDLRYNYISFNTYRWVFSSKVGLTELEVYEFKEYIDYISESENKGATLVETDYSDILEVYLSETNFPDYPYSQKRKNNQESLQDRQRAKKKMEKEKKREKHKQRIAKQSKLEQKIDKVDLNNSQILSVFNFLWSQTVIWAFYGAIYLFESCSKDFMYGELLSIFIKVSLLALLTSTIGFVLSSKKKTHPTTRSMSNGWSEMFYFFFTVLILIVAAFCCVFVTKLVFAPSHISSVQNEIKPYCYTIIGMFLISRMYFDAD